MIARGKVLVLAVTLAATCAFGGVDGFPLVTGGRAAAEVVLPREPVSLQFKADIAFFTNAVHACTGVELPVVARRTHGSLAIVFELVKRGFFEADEHEIAFPNEKTLTVRGTLHSCRWALNRILEKNFGCVFCLPGPHGTCFPKAKDVSVRRESFKGAASLRVERKMYADDTDWMRSLGGREAARHGQFYGHAMWKVLSPLRLRGTTIYADVMPEKDGVRREIGKIHSGWQPCFSSEAGIREAVRFLNEYFDAHPNEKAMSLAVNDIGGHCTCANCARANGGFSRRSRFYPQYVDYSPVYYSWANRVAAGVAARHPDVALGLLAYCEVTDPPPFRLHPILVPFVCTEIHQMMDDAAARRRRELFSAWSAKSDHVANWGYDYGSSTYAVPRLSLAEQRAYFGMKTDGTCPVMDGYFGEGDGLIGEGPKRYMFYRQMFDAACDFDSELDRWYRAVGGDEAAPHLRAYYDEWERFWTGEAVRKSAWFRGVTGVYFIYYNHSYLYEFDCGILERTTEHLAAALAAATRSGDADQVARMNRLAAFHQFYSARIRAMGAGHVPAGSADAAVRFLDALPEISDAVREKARWGEQVLSDLGYPAYPVGRMPPYREALNGFRQKAHAAREGNFTQLLNCAVGWARRSPAVEAAVSRASENGRVLPEVREQLKMLTLSESLPNLASGATEEKTLRLFTWDKDGLPPGKALYCSLRLTNRRVGRQNYRVYFAGWNPKRGVYRDADEVFLSVGPGETRDVALFCRTADGVTKGRIAVHMWQNELGSVDDLEVSDVRLCALPTPADERPFLHIVSNLLLQGRPDLILPDSAFRSNAVPVYVQDPVEKERDVWLYDMHTLDKRLLKDANGAERPFWIRRIARPFRTRMFYFGQVLDDHELLDAWCEKHPGFLGFLQLEWVNDSMMPWQAYVKMGHRKDPVQRVTPEQAESIRHRPEYAAAWAEATNREVFARGFLKNHFQKVLSMHANDPSRFWMGDGIYTADHLLADWGVEGIVFETTENYSFWQIPLMFVRGAATQYGLDYIWYLASFYRGIDSDGTLSGNNRGQTKADEPTNGLSVSAMKRVMYLTYLSGARGWQREGGRGVYVYTRDPDATKNGTYGPEGQLLEPFYDFVRANPRGESHRTTAIVVPISRGYSRLGGKAFRRFAYTRGEYTLDALMSTILDYPENLTETLYKSGTERVMANSKYGDVFDVLCPDGERRETFAAALAKYKVAVVVDDFRDADRAALEKDLADFEAKGGRVVRIMQDMVPWTTPEAALEAVTGASCHPIRYQEIENLLDEAVLPTLPFRVKGTVQFGFNRIKNGWLVYFINNGGVVKFGDRVQEIAPGGEEVTVEVGAASRFEMRELIVGSPLRRTSGETVSLDVPYGDIRVLRMLQKGNN